MLLGQGETVYHQGAVERWHDGRPGLLTLTNHRILFETGQQQGLISTAIHGQRNMVDFELPLSALSDVQVEPHVFGRPVLYLQSLAGPRRFKTPEAEGWRALIVRARSVAPAHPQAGYGTPVIVNVSNVQAPPAYPSPQQLLPPPPAPPRVLVRCPYCKNAYDESLGRCPRCGAGF
jgi:hypothetical protein